MVKYFEDVKEVFESIEQLHVNTTNYLNSLDVVEHKLSEFLIENKFNGCIVNHMEFVQKKLLGDELYDLIQWYIYDRPDVDDSIKDTHYNIETKGVKYLITDMKSLLDYVKINYNFPYKGVE